MNNPNRATLIAKLQKTLKKHYKPLPTPERTLLEHLLYACCLENAPFDKADEAFAQLQQNYFDWNEVRVTSVNELAEVFAPLPQPMAAAHRIKKLLQGLFDAIFTFDLEPLKKQNLGKTIKDIEKFGATPFAQAYVTQAALGGHAIAADEGTFDVMVVLGIASDSEAAKGLLPGLERAVPKNKGAEFFTELHQLAADYFANPNSTKLKAILSEIVPDVKERVAARQVKRKEITAETAKAVAAERERERQAEAEMMNPQKPPAVKEKEAAAAAKEAKEKDKPAAKAPVAKPPAKGAAPAAKEAPAKPAAKEPPKAAKDLKSKPAKGTEKAPTDKAKPAAKKAPEPPAKKKPEVKKKAADARKPVSKGLTKKKPR